MSTRPPSPVVLVHEAVTGGGCPDRALPQPLATEALTILQAILADFHAWGRVRVVTTRDRRLPEAALPADQVVEIDPADYPSRMLQVAEECGTVLLIAPETGGLLERLSAAVLDTGAALLGSSPAAIATAADKWACHRHLSAAGLPTPFTALVEPQQARRTARELGYPVLIKPRRGTACEGVCLVRDDEALAEALAQAHPDEAGRILVQEHVAGTPASVSLLAAGGASVALGLNEQELIAGVPCEYVGGTAGIEHQLRNEAFALARSAVDSLPGLRGHVGVDLILARKGCTLIEINPRPTTSYIGLRRVVPCNLAAALWRACLEDTLPGEFRPGRPAAFRKVMADGV